MKRPWAWFVIAVLAALGGCTDSSISSGDRVLVSKCQYETGIRQPSRFGDWIGLLVQFLPILIFIGLILFMMRQAQGSNSQAMSFGKSRARMFTANKPSVTFVDVAGVDEAKEELQEVVEFSLQIPCEQDVRHIEATLRAWHDRERSGEPLDIQPAQIVQNIGMVSDFTAHRFKFPVGLVEFVHLEERDRQGKTCLEN